MADFGTDLAREIGVACEHFDRDKAREFAGQLAIEIRGSGEPCPSRIAKSVLTALRRKRYFDVALDLADAVFESGQYDPTLRVVYAQALIDSGRIAAAIPYVEALLVATPAGSHPHDEALGLLGRAYKQLYVNGGGEPFQRTEYLIRAFTAYYDAYAKNPALTWHGVNAAALRHRADEDDVKLPQVPAFERDLFDAAVALVESGAADEWGQAVAGEAALAVDNPTYAKKAYAAYAGSSAIDAFELASSLRQLEEVWRLTNDKDPGSAILPLLRAELLKRSGGAVRLDSTSIVRETASARDAGEERTFGDESVRTIRWYQTGLERAHPICRIERLDFYPKGTGFLVRGGDFHPSLGDELLVLTNHHVISNDPAAITAENALARFEALSRTKTYEFSEIVWSSRELDATLVRFAGEPPKAEVCPIRAESPTRAKNQPPPVPRVYVIGHPLGGPLSISLYDNELLASDGHRLHYRAPTEPGSSGSPVFDADWQLVGLHHLGGWKIPSLFGGGETYDANEAFWIGAIRDACSRGAGVRPRPRPRSARPSTRARKSSRRRT